MSKTAKKRITRPAEKSASDDSLSEERAALESERKQIEAEKASLRAERDELAKQLDSDREDRAVLQQRIKAMENVVGDKKTMTGPMRGHQVVVERGGVIGYDTLLGTETVLGGWVKCADDVDPDYRVPLIAIALEKFSYDSASGAPMHSIRYQKYKRFFENGGAKTVGAREPKSDVSALGV